MKTIHIACNPLLLELIPTQILSQPLLNIKKFSKQSIQTSLLNIMQYSSSRRTIFNCHSLITNRGKMEDYYKTLGVEKSATKQEIRERYLFLVKAYHPDRYQDIKDKKKAEDELKKINEATLQSITIGITERQRAIKKLVNKKPLQHQIPKTRKIQLIPPLHRTTVKVVELLM